MSSFKNSKDIPVLRNTSQWYVWKESFAIWLYCTDLVIARIVPYCISVGFNLCESVQEIGRQGWREHAQKWTKGNDQSGIEHFLKYMEGKLGVDEQESLTRHVVQFLRCVRKGKESYKDFLTRFTLARQAGLRVGDELCGQDYLSNVLLSDGMKLNKTEAQLLKQSCDIKKVTHDAFVRKIETLIINPHMSYQDDPEGDVHMMGATALPASSSNDAPVYLPDHDDDGQDWNEWDENDWDVSTQDPNPEMYEAFAAFFKSYSGNKSKGSGKGGNGKGGGKNKYHGNNYNNNNKNNRGKGGKGYRQKGTFSVLDAPDGADAAEDEK